MQRLPSGMGRLRENEENVLSFPGFSLSLSARISLLRWLYPQLLTHDEHVLSPSQSWSRLPWTRHLSHHPGGDATPIGSPTHMLVYGPGGYRFSDFLRIGVPMSFIILAANILIVNLVYPLTPLQ